MKITITETMFEKMLKATKNGVQKNDWNRPVLQYIRLKIEGGTVTAMVCDGYTGARFRFLSTSNDGEDFTCLIKPIRFKASKNGTLPVVIELADNEALLDVPTEYGRITYRFKQMYEWDDKLDGIFDKMKNHDREIAINASLMERIMRSFSDVKDDKTKAVVLQSKDSQTQGFCMYADTEKFTLEQFLLPLRMRDKGGDV